jgi:hypothetical protein
MTGSAGIILSYSRPMKLLGTDPARARTVCRNIDLSDPGKLILEQPALASWEQTLSEEKPPTRN